MNNTTQVIMGLSLGGMTLAMVLIVFGVMIVFGYIFFGLFTITTAVSIGTAISQEKSLTNK